jgi:hypothetical protein
VPPGFLVGYRIHVAEAEGTDEQRALVALGHLTRGEHARRPDFDLEARRQLDLLDQRSKFCFRCTGRRAGWRYETLLLLVLVAEEPVIRWMVQNSLLPDS